MLRMPIPFFISLGMLITMTFLSTGLWAALPADSFTHPAITLFLLPAAMLLVIFIFVISPMIKPSTLDRPGLYAAIWLFVILAMALGHGLVIRQALFALAPA